VLAAIETAHMGEVEALRGQVEALKTLADSAAMRLVDAESRGTDLKAELERARADHREALQRLQAEAVGAGAAVRNLGEVKWRAIEDGSPGTGNGRAVACFILDTSRALPPA
jgi:hypothetical protein